MAIDSVSAFQGGSSGSYYVPGAPPPTQKKKKAPFSKDSLESLANEEGSVVKATKEMGEQEELQWVSFFKHLFKKYFRFFFFIRKGSKNSLSNKKMEKPAPIKNLSVFSKAKGKAQNITKKCSASFSSICSFFAKHLKIWGMKIHSRCAPPYNRLKQATKAQLKRIESFLKRNFEKIKAPVLARAEKILIKGKKATLWMKKHTEKIKNALVKRLKVPLDYMREWTEQKALPKLRQVLERGISVVEAQRQKIKVAMHHIQQATASFLTPIANRLQAVGKIGLRHTRGYLKRFQRVLGKMGESAKQKSEKFFSFVLKIFAPPIVSVASLLYETLESLWVRLFRICRQFLAAVFDIVYRLAKNGAIMTVNFIKKIPGLTLKFLFHLGTFLKNVPLLLWKGLKWVDAALYRLFRRAALKPKN